MDYEKKYKEALELARKLYNMRGDWTNLEIESIFPELRKSEDEKIRKFLIQMAQNGHGEDKDWWNKCVAWLETQGEQKSSMIKWTGDNLKEVIGFTGKDKNFDKWFTSFEEYEKYVRNHGYIFKIFNEDGSHYEVPINSWIVKTPDGYNVPSKFMFRQKPAEWSEEDKEMFKSIITRLHSHPDVDKTEYDKSYHWLKSLRPQWKPSDEQMVALKEGCDEHWEPDGLDPLYTLYQDLKKLKDEEL